MPAFRKDSPSTANLHSRLTTEFVAAGIDTSRFGFYDQPAFLARERVDPGYLERYAEWVATRPISPEYEAHVRATVPKLAGLLADAFAADAMECRCIAAYSMMTRMLDRLGVWSFGLFGSTILGVPSLDLRRTIHTIAFRPQPVGVLGHAWICAPPFVVVDISLALQHWGASPIAPYIPPAVLADTTSPIVRATVEDCVSDEIRAMFAETEGRRDPFLHLRFDPRLVAFHRKFPAREVEIGALRLRFVPFVVRQPFELLEQINLEGEGRPAIVLWNEIVAPAFGRFPGRFRP